MRSDLDHANKAYSEFVEACTKVDVEAQAEMLAASR
jgi:hypothetical protein